MSTRQKLNKKIARQIREEIAEAIHASAERIAEIRKKQFSKPADGTPHIRFR